MRRSRFSEKQIVGELRGGRGGSADRGVAPAFGVGDAHEKIEALRKGYNQGRFHSAPG